MIMNRNNNGFVCGIEIASFLAMTGKGIASFLAMTGRVIQIVSLQERLSL